MKLRFPIPAGIVLIAACGLSACKPQAPAAHEEVRPVRTVVVGSSDGSVGANWSGEILARYESKLGFQVSGRIVSRLVEVGSHVRRGQPLMRLDPSQEVLHVASADAEVDAARSRVEQDRVDLARTEQLLAKQFASQAEVDQARLSLAQSESKLRSAVAQHQIKQNQRGYTTLFADRDGVVTAINVEAGQVVSAGQAVLTVAADGEREVRVSIAESRVDEMRRAKALQVSVWAQPGRTYRGVLRELAPDADSVTRTYSARITVLDTDRDLRLGMTAAVYAADVQGSTAIRLPLTAIHDRTGQPQVWVVDPSTSQVGTRAVKLGAAQGDSVLVTSGVSGGETVVTAGVNLLHAGQKVKLAGSSAPVAVAGAQK